ncbi:MAG: nucleotidyltransferase family protein [Candidatus Nanopelagicales bacterium]
MPQVSNAADGQQVDLLVDVIRCALAREAHALGLEVDDHPLRLSQLDASAFAHAVRLHRVSHLIAQYGDDLGLPAQVLDLVQETATNEALAAMTLAMETPRFLELLASGGVPALAFKGVALSMLTTGTVTERGNGDVDVLVHKRNVPRAVGLLLGDGCEIDVFSSEQVTNWWPWIRWSTRELLFLCSPAQVDLHWQIAKENDLLPPTEQLLARSQSVEILGAPIATLGNDDTLLASCYHLHHDAYRSLRHSVDLVRLLRMRQVPIEWTGRSRTMAAESAHFAIGLLGGLPAGHLEALGLEAVPVKPAFEQWQAHRCDPLAQNRAPGLLGTFSETRANYRHSQFMRELPRMVGIYSLIRLAPRVEGPLTAPNVVRALIKRS